MMTSTVDRENFSKNSWGLYFYEIKTHENFFAMKIIPFEYFLFRMTVQSIVPFVSRKGEQIHDIA